MYPGGGVQYILQLYIQFETQKIPTKYPSYVSDEHIIYLSIFSFEHEGSIITLGQQMHILKHQSHLAVLISKYSGSYMLSYTKLLGYLLMSITPPGTIAVCLHMHPLESFDLQPSPSNTYITESFSLRSLGNIKPILNPLPLDKHQGKERELNLPAAPVGHLPKQATSSKQHLSKWVSNSEKGAWGERQSLRLRKH